MRYTKIALLIFGLGIVAGLVVVAGEFLAWQPPAAGLMALGLVLIPVGLFADGHGMAAFAWLAARLSRRRPVPRRAKPRPPAARRKRPTTRAAGKPSPRTRRR
jgi:membrane protein implicated in regulation of membrane protease activity